MEIVVLEEFNSKFGYIYIAWMHRNTEHRHIHSCPFVKNAIYEGFYEIWCTAISVSFTML